MTTVWLVEKGTSAQLRRCLWALAMRAPLITEVACPEALPEAVRGEFLSRFVFREKGELPGTTFLNWHPALVLWDRLEEAPVSSLLLTVFRLPARLKDLLDDYGSNLVEGMVEMVMTDPVQTPFYPGESRWGWVVPGNGVGKLSDQRAVWIA